MTCRCKFLLEGKSWAVFVVHEKRLRPRRDTSRTEFANSILVEDNCN